MKAMLSLEEIKRLVKERPNKDYIEAGIKHQNRLRLHSETVLNKNNLSPAFKDLTAWLGSKQPELLPSDKMERFEQLCTAPLPTLSLTGDIFTYLYRVFEGQDAFARYKFRSPENQTDWNLFSDTDFWKTTGYSAMQMAIDSVWIVELPEEQTTDRPEPKDRLIDISQVIHIENDRDNNCKVLIFESCDKLYVYDDEYISVYDFKNEKVGSPIVQIAHGLGYCPARMFWTDALQPRNLINKKAPLTSVLGDLDWLLVLKVFKKYMDMSNAYPIIAAYEGNDDYTEVERAEQDGRTTEEKSLKNSFIGPGTLWTVSAPRQGEPDLMSNPVKLISPDIETLKHHTDTIDQWCFEIFRKVTGNAGDPENNQAKNEKQILSGFESQMIVLRRIASNFEAIQTFADKVKIALRYGPDELDDIAIDYGSRFFLKSVEEIVSGIKTLKEAGGDEGLIDASVEELLETRFRNDKNSLLRSKILRDLDPLPDKSIAEAKEIYDLGGISKIDFVIKSNKISFAKRFDREQMPIQFFGESLSYDQRINKIKEEFKKYANENDSSEQRPAAPDQGE